MKATGRFNPFTNQEIMQVEEHDIMWQDKEWNKLSDTDKCDFLSFMNIKYLNDSNRDEVKSWYEYYRDKNLINL